MKESKLKELITQHTNAEGVINFAEISKEVNDFANGIVAKNKPDTDKLYAEGVANFLKENNFDDKASFTAFVKNGSTADSERVNEIKLELETAKNRITELNGIETDYNAMKNRNLIRTKGISDNEKIEFMEYKINKQVKDDITFEDAFNSYVEANPTQFEVTPQKPHYVSTGKGVKPNNQTNDKTAIDIILEQKYGNKYR